MRSGVTAREKERAERATLVQQEKLSKAKVRALRPAPSCFCVSLLKAGLQICQPQRSKLSPLTVRDGSPSALAVKELAGAVPMADVLAHPSWAVNKKVRRPASSGASPISAS